MPAFMTRVELHGATYDDYEKLHAAMEAEGFARMITAGGGGEYSLPTAEYYRVVNLAMQQVLDSAKRAASRTGKNYSAVVTEANGVTWTGLQQVR